MNKLAMRADPGDPEDFDVTEEDLLTAQRARQMRKIRQALDLSQEALAERFGIPVGTLRDWEQVRTAAPPYILTLYRLIEHDPELAAKKAQAAKN